ncbi:hypothetical protein D4764_08G0011330 [Takifugu flavidus]|uniref:Uncharacterized protein n=1 Tax=Takifugu flavidus TaxID=433684 RepID=A0A5C6MPQ4_9TELE|nr:hypothetical protein D4764_08G0011330 [Takifugu flavidus]
MFLYWKKRGAYELEASPPSLAEERYSWASSLDVIHNLRELGRESIPRASRLLCPSGLGPHGFHLRIMSNCPASV